MTDRELLEKAAKAAGVTVIWDWYAGDDENGALVTADGYVWNPLTDDGDALRLAVKLNLLILPYPADNAVRVVHFETNENTIVSWGAPPDPYAATRRAIVRAAAAIGETK